MALSTYQSNHHDARDPDQNGHHHQLNHHGVRRHQLDQNRHHERLDNQTDGALQPIYHARRYWQPDLPSTDFLQSVASETPLNSTFSIDITLNPSANDGARRQVHEEAAELEQAAREIFDQVSCVYRAPQKKSQRHHAASCEKKIGSIVKQHITFGRSLREKMTESARTDLEMVEWLYDEAARMHKGLTSMIRRHLAEMEQTIAQDVKQRIEQLQSARKAHLVGPNKYSLKKIWHAGHLPERARLAGLQWRCNSWTNDMDDAFHKLGRCVLMSTIGDWDYPW